MEKGGLLNPLFFPCNGPLLCRVKPDDQALITDALAFKRPGCADLDNAFIISRRTLEVTRPMCEVQHNKEPVCRGRLTYKRDQLIVGINGDKATLRKCGLCLSQLNESSM
jgi:hypothetical protein